MNIHLLNSTYSNLEGRVDSLYLAVKYKEIQIECEILISSPLCQSLKSNTMISL